MIAGTRAKRKSEVSEGEAKGLGHKAHLVYPVGVPLSIELPAESKQQRSDERLEGEEGLGWSGSVDILDLGEVVSGRQGVAQLPRKRRASARAHGSIKSQPTSSRAPGDQRRHP